LFTFPDPIPIPEWSEVGIDDETAGDWHELLERLWARPMADRDGDPVPHVARFDAPGLEAWVRHHNGHTAEMNAPDFDPALRGAWGKFREYAGRLALILACLDHAADPTADPTAVPAAGRRAVEGAWRLIAYFKGHTRKAHVAIAGSGGRGATSKLLGAIRSAPAGLTREDIRKNVFSGNRNSEETDELLGRLEQKGLVHCRKEKTGGRPAERWFAGRDATL
jgi:hypothetical protein